MWSIDSISRDSELEHNKIVAHLSNNKNRIPRYYIFVRFCCGFYRSSFHLSIFSPNAGIWSVSNLLYTRLPEFTNYIESPKIWLYILAQKKKNYYSPGIFGKQNDHAELIVVQNQNHLYTIEVFMQKCRPRAGVSLFVSLPIASVGYISNAPPPLVVQNTRAAGVHWQREAKLQITCGKHKSHVWVFSKKKRLGSKVCDLILYLCVCVRGMRAAYIKINTQKKGACWFMCFSFRPR